MGGTHPFGQTGAILPRIAARRRIEREDLVFVAAHKHRMGWQTMATILRVNVLDLRRACERGYVEAEPEPPAPKPKTNNLPTVDPLKVLRAIQRGAASAADIADLVSCSPRHATALVGDLKRLGWLAGDGRSYVGWVVTAAGVEALRGVQP